MTNINLLHFQNHSLKHRFLKRQCPYAVTQGHINLNLSIFTRKNTKHLRFDTYQHCDEYEKVIPNKEYTSANKSIKQYVTSGGKQ